MSKTAGNGGLRAVDDSQNLYRVEWLSTSYPERVFKTHSQAAFRADDINQVAECITKAPTSLKLGPCATVRVYLLELDDETEEPVVWLLFETKLAVLSGVLEAMEGNIMTFDFDAG